MKNQKCTILLEKTKNYTIEEKKDFDYAYLIALISEVDDVDFEKDKFLNEQLDSVFKSFPKKIDNIKLVPNKNTRTDISNLKKHVKNKYNLIPRLFYLEKWLEIGKYIGFFLSIIAFHRLFKVTIDTYIISTFLKIVVSIIGQLLLSIIGLPVGIVIGFIIGYPMDKWAERNNRVI